MKLLVIQLSNYFWPSKNRRQFIKSWCKITVKPLKLKLIVCSLISIVWLQIHKNYKYVSLSNKLLTSLYKPEKKKKKNTFSDSVLFAWLNISSHFFPLTLFFGRSAVSPMREDKSPVHQRTQEESHSHSYSHSKALWTFQYNKLTCLWTEKTRVTVVWLKHIVPNY